ncbi:preprotein translocase subunit YajC [Candidatus Sumerlaeota bacterium]|nr:preprotein translocase subunit YajC [Candidatus Sumerlaeota bacterium]
MLIYELPRLCNGILTAGNGAQKPQDFNQLLFIGMFVMIGFSFYLIIMRPYKKEQSEKKRLLENLKKGDKVVTIGGIHGVVVEIEEADNSLVLEVAKNVRMKFLRGAISTVIKE